MTKRILSQQISEQLSRYPCLVPLKAWQLSANSSRLSVRTPASEDDLITSAAVDSAVPGELSTRLSVRTPASEADLITSAAVDSAVPGEVECSSPPTEEASHARVSVAHEKQWIAEPAMSLCLYI